MYSSCTLSSSPLHAQCLAECQTRSRCSQNTYRIQGNCYVWIIFCWPPLNLGLNLSLTFLGSDKGKASHSWLSSQVRNEDFYPFSICSLYLPTNNNLPQIGKNDRAILLLSSKYIICNVTIHDIHSFIHSLIHSIMGIWLTLGI